MIRTGYHKGGPPSSVTTECWVCWGIHFSDK